MWVIKRKSEYNIIYICKIKKRCQAGKLQHLLIEIVKYSLFVGASDYFLLMQSYAINSIQQNLF